MSKENEIQDTTIGPIFELPLKKRKRPAGLQKEKEDENAPIDLPKFEYNFLYSKNHEVKNTKSKRVSSEQETTTTGDVIIPTQKSSQITITNEYIRLAKQQLDREREFFNPIYNQAPLNSNNLIHEKGAENSGKWQDAKTQSNLLEAYTNRNKQELYFENNILQTMNELGMITPYFFVMVLSGIICLVVVLTYNDYVNREGGDKGNTKRFRNSFLADSSVCDDDHEVSRPPSKTNWDAGSKPNNTKLTRKITPHPKAKKNANKMNRSNIRRSSLIVTDTITKTVNKKLIQEEKEKYHTFSDPETGNLIFVKDGETNIPNEIFEDMERTSYLEDMDEGVVVEKGKKQHQDPSSVRHSNLSYKSNPNFVDSNLCPITLSEITLDSMFGMDCNEIVNCRGPGFDQQFDQYCIKGIRNTMV